MLDSCGSLAERRIGSPARAAIDGLRGPRQCLHCRFDQSLLGGDELRRRHIVVARALVAQSTIDQHEIGRRGLLHDLSRRGHADQKPAARNEQLFCDEHRERSADRTADYAEAFARVFEFEKIGVVARPAW